ncbi:hypothetical protein FSP39_007635 [Pinctada imbricata]|uniref:Uncharacterized protein n=1 Tax=Pinctada imbricata TaxID=66713 RepID=A0AA89BX00_PINIB|nr:hypothetical protein FSP39_007635 [Pinctada imbricata]
MRETMRTRFVQGLVKVGYSINHESCKPVGLGLGLGLGLGKPDRYPRSTYERLFRKELGYNNKLHRDDREHAKLRGLTVNNEEKVKEVPTLSSTEYGHRLDLHVDHPDRKHVRIATVRAEFYRRNGITS